MSAWTISPSGGDLAGFARLRGSRAQIADVPTATRWRSASPAPTMTSEPVRCVVGVVGDGIARGMADLPEENDDIA